MRLLTILAVCLGTTNAMAGAVCTHGSPAVLELMGWTTTASTEGMEISLTVFNPGEREINAIDAIVHFVGISGKVIGQITVDPDLHLDGGQYIYDGGVMDVASGTDISDHSKVNSIICTTSVVYADGTKQIFK